MSSECTCTPGTEEGGWHEDRCEACLQAELDEWRRLGALPLVAEARRRWLESQQRDD